MYQNKNSLYKKKAIYFILLLVLPKKQRLTARDVLFLSKKRQFLPAGFFGFFYVKQYTNLEYNQFSIHVSIKYAKSSVVRNQMKRAVFAYLQNNDRTHKKLGKSYYKIFIIVNKARVAELQKYFANIAQKDIFISVQKLFEQNFIYFGKKLSWKE